MDVCILLFNRNMCYLWIQRTKYILLVLTTLFYLSVSVTSSSECNSLPCYNGKCKDNGTVCECFDGWAGASCSHCTGRIRLSGPEGVISDGVGNYSEDNKCMWLLEPDPPGSPIRFSTDQFATECGWDHLYIFDGDSVFAPVIGAYSGLVLPEINVNKSLLEIIAYSGKAYLYFYSDAAYNMTGFSLKYRVGDCPLNCSDVGTCVNKTCVCDSQYMGEYCEIQKCPDSCSDQGQCIEGICHCNETFKGKDCSLSVKLETWTSVDNLKPPDGRASSASVLIGDELWVTGGYSFGTSTDFLVVYNITSRLWRTVHPVSTDNPAFLYGHSVVKYKDCLYLFGGVSGKHIESQLWIYNMTENRWLYHDYNETESLAGHTAVVVGNVMYVIFGHSPVYGYMNRVRELNLDDKDRTITLAETSGALVKGGYGHSSVYHNKTGEIFVYAGYISGSTTQYSLTDKLYSYHPVLKHWKILARSFSPRYLHSAVLLGDQMLVFGGNTHNDTSVSYGAKCYSPDFMAYDIECNSWRYITSAALPPNAARYGHISHTYTDSTSGRSRMYVFGGFTGMMLNDLLEYEPGDCGLYTNDTECLSSFPGRMCVWTGSECLDRQTADKKVKDGNITAYESHQNCTPSEGAPGYCKAESSCGSCLSTAYNCKWCSNNCTTSCRTTDQYKISSVSKCPHKYRVVCDQINNCLSCSTFPDCIWNNSDTTCRFRGQHSWFESMTNDTKSVQTCEKPCSEYSSCENCTKKSCMWCVSQQRCVETNSYVASFLYGQCQEWTTQSDRCTATRCSELHTCDDCKLNPACGWCNDPSNTGLGKCMHGSATGPVQINETTGTYKVDPNVCPAERWHFIKCPLCQCNGHSTCNNVSDVCDQCQNLTEGSHCEKCKESFWGSPKNGANCSACSCNGQADSCHSVSGACFCRTRGVKGDQCDICDTGNNYFGNPNNGGTCYYDLRTDYSFTFNLSKPEDKHFTGINFMNIPLSADRDVDFTVNCSGSAYLNITWKSKSHPQEQYKVREYMCSYFRAKFEHKEFNFGPDENVTFHVYVYGFETPFWLQISFSQFPKIDLVHFFVTFFSCFLSLLIIAAVLYKIKHKYDSYRRRQRMIVEMEEMASRPFAVAVLEMEKKVDPSQAEKKDVNPDLRKRKRISTNKPGQVALEPLHNQKAAVISLFIQLPTGNDEWTPAGNTGLAIGSALVTLGHQRKQSIEHGKTDKAKHKKQAISSHDTCV